MLLQCFLRCKVDAELLAQANGEAVPMEELQQQEETRHDKNKGSDTGKDKCDNIGTSHYGKGWPIRQNIWLSAVIYIYITGFRVSRQPWVLS